MPSPQKRAYQKELDGLLQSFVRDGRRPKVLLHVCCGPCASYVIEYLQKHVELHIYYDNPNIQDEAEYERRRLALERLLYKLDPEGRIAYSASPYKPSAFFAAVAGLESLGEGSARCEACIRLRMERASAKAKELGADFVASTLSISPHKDAPLINELGEEAAAAAGLRHLPNDFKKKGGFQRSLELCKAWDLYRQDYCGCVFSRLERRTNQKEEPMTKMYVLVESPEHQQEAIRQAFSGEVIFKKEKDMALEDWAQAEIIVGHPDPKKLLTCPRLHWLQLPTAGYDAMEEAGLLDGRMTVSNAVGAYGHAVSEHMLAMLFAFLKKLPTYYEQQAQGLWKKGGQVRSISGLKTLVYGYGDLGQSFAKRLHALGSEVYGVRRKEVDRPPELAEIYRPEQVDEILQEMDLIAFFLPSSKESRALVNQDWLSRVKQGAILLNGGRGDLIVADDCIQALEDGRLGGLLLDVLPEEPLPQDHPLWHAPNCLITPHVAGWFNMAETVDAVFDIILENIRRHEEGRLLHNIVVKRKD